MDADLRASIFVALGAAALSAIVGILAGVRFGPIVARAIIGGALVGGATYGAVWLIRTKLPGLLPERDGGDGTDVGFGEGPDETESGSRVNIVLPGEEPEARADAEDVEDAAPAEVLPADGEGEPSIAEGPGEASFLDEKPIPAAPVAAMPPASYGGAQDPKAEGVEDLDVLPDLDGFTDSFAAAEFNSSNGAASHTRAEEPGSQRPSDGLDPASLAKAVRTILKRDQKG